MAYCKDNFIRKPSFLELQVSVSVNRKLRRRKKMTVLVSNDHFDDI